jgi:undecaprenyl phosphate-alpha-L-ara4N flippase subunit ArnE
MTAWVWVALAAALNCTALVLLRLAERGMAWQAPVWSVSWQSLAWLGLSLLAYAVAFVLTIRILSVHAFGQAVPVFVALQFVFSLLAARWVFQESVSWLQLCGVLLIVGGVTLVAWKS